MTGRLSGMSGMDVFKANKKTKQAYNRLVREAKMQKKRGLKKIYQ